MYEIAVYKYDNGKAEYPIWCYFSNSRDEAIRIAEKCCVRTTICYVTNWRTGELTYKCWTED